MFSLSQEQHSFGFQVSETSSNCVYSGREKERFRRTRIRPLDLKYLLSYYNRIELQINQRESRLQNASCLLNTHFNNTHIQTGRCPTVGVHPPGGSVCVVQSIQVLTQPSSCYNVPFYSHSIGNGGLLDGPPFYSVVNSTIPFLNEKGHYTAQTPRGSSSSTSV